MLVFPGSNDRLMLKVRSAPLWRSSLRSCVRMTLGCDVMYGGGRSMEGKKLNLFHFSRVDGLKFTLGA